MSFFFALLLVPVLLNISMLAQRPVSRWMRVPGSIWPLLPFADQVKLRQQLAVRGAGVVFTFALVFAALVFQAHREQRLVPRVEVVPGGAAAEAGVLSGDWVVSVQGIAITDFSGIRDALLAAAPDQKLTMVVRREGRELELQVRLHEGLLGVKASGETIEGSSGSAIRLAVKRLIGTPDESPNSRAWLVALNGRLTLAWWMMLLVEVAALAVNSTLRTLRR